MFVHSNIPKNYFYLSFIYNVIWSRLYSNLLIVASVMVSEYEMVCIWETVAKAILVNCWIYICFQYVFQSWGEYYVTKKFVYIRLCRFLRVCSDSGSCCEIRVELHTCLKFCVNVHFNSWDVFLMKFQEEKNMFNYIKLLSVVWQVPYCKSNVIFIIIFFPCNWGKKNNCEVRFWRC